MHIACLDTESTSTGKYNEILELAIYSARGELLLNSLYKPKKNRRWPHSERVHGISPLMVQNKPHFQDNLRKIQKIFDRSEMILGFALINDVKILEKSGVTGLTPEKCMDVRELYWAVYGEEMDMDLYHVPSLIKCAEQCNYQWDEKDAHSAAADALATLHCFNVLMEKFIIKYQICDLDPDQVRLTDEQLHKAWDYLHQMIKDELHRRAVEKAKGWLFLLLGSEGYYFIVRKKPFKKAQLPQSEQVEPLEGEPEEKPEEKNNSAQIIAGIELADSSKGYNDMHVHFADKLVQRNGYYNTFYQLAPEDIQYFRGYTNVYEA